MASVLHPPDGGQASRSHSRPHNPASDRVAFVLFIETREAFRILEAVAADGLRAPSRRKYTKAEAGALYAKACSSLAWLLAATPPEPAPTRADAPPQARHEGPAGSEAWCE
jgi:hypothetical protein